MTKEQKEKLKRLNWEAKNWFEDCVIAIHAPCTIKELERALKGV